ncbi:beta-lactamase hydrolase domain-containing protein [Leptolyngbya sp. 7M]|uniref:beta-lactamase hydrolase domain-containing protein n=1 Tax=Leptolyngbya sp. 7M TaxID=2812896 RepID=UPI001B8CA2A8|nr:sulfur transferase domain-containing protein [Leptolyngbya sp. 7M]QYO63942.1 hypothetical protein JVX88_29735 [Leptolyngbya sp. 7M]
MSQADNPPKPIGKDLYAGGQPDAEAIQQLAEQGFKSIVNLRSPDEAGALSDEQQQATAAGLEYVNVPLSPGEADDSLMAKVLWEVEKLPTPVFFHCGAGARAGALALIALATQQGLNREQVIAKAEEVGVNVEQPHLKSFLESLE